MPATPTRKRHTHAASVINALPDRAAPHPSVAVVGARVRGPDRRRSAGRHGREGTAHHIYCSATIPSGGRYGIGLSSRLCGQGCVVLLLMIRVEVL